MGNGPDVPGEWDSSGPSEPPAQLLRRAISHVESLLNRLENPGEQLPSESPVTLAEPVRTPEHVHSESVFGPPPSGPPAPAETANNVVELARNQPEEPQPEERQPEEPQRHEPPPSIAPAEVAPAEVAPAAPSPASAEPDYVPLAGVSSTAQAEALRITLHAHEEAHRLRAEANGLRAEAAAEGERILVEARMLSDRLHVESREGATELLAAAKAEAEAIIAGARAEADRITQSARDDSAAVRAELDADAEQERVQALAAALADAERDAERIRADALDQGRAEAARLVQAEAAAAAIESRLAVEASCTRAEQLLEAANTGVADVRGCMRRLLEEMNQALVAFNSSVGSVESLRDAVAELAPPDEAADGTIAEGRRPLGLLFGAPHG